ncbi:MAG: fimbrillin family protein [Bacteroidales bacterium]|nr:fimbrillin family protein [Bacteroidales bacterium]
MKKTFHLLIPILAAICLLGVVSCEKDYTGKVIRFKAITSVTGAESATKTSYSGVVNAGRERIDWKVDDIIRIASDLAETEGGDNYADYVISGTPAASGATSTAELAVSGTDGLLWGSGTHHFWGIYPSHAITVSGSGSASATGLSIPATQNVIDDAEHKTSTSTLTTFTPDLSSAWMLADKSGVTEGSSDFTMDFYPAFTAFEFNLKSQDDITLKIKSFTLSSTTSELAGTFAVTAFADGGASTFGSISSASTSISVSFGEGVDVTQTKSLTFTVLALPQVLNNLSITFNIEKGGAASYRTLPLKYSSTHPTNPDEFISFAACNKHRITGLALPNGELLLSALTVSAWDSEAATAVDYSYNYVSPAAAKIKACEEYRRYDTDSDYSNWDESFIVVSYGYMNHDGEVIITNTPDASLRSAFSPVIEVATESESNTVLRLVLDNPNFKFVQYNGNAAAVSDHSLTDAIEIPSGASVQTYFSVVPVKQFRIDAPESEKKCIVSLLSVESGTFHEMSFNNAGTPDYYRLPGESNKELTFYYVGPAVYTYTGTLYNPNGTVVTP